MKTTHAVFFGLAALVCTMVPANANAYYTTNQTVTKLNDETALFTIEYGFGLAKNDIYMPIAAERDLAWGSLQHTLGYTLLEDGKTVTQNGTTTAMVFSNTTIENGMYKIAKGAGRTMTLVVLLQTPKTATEMDFALNVTQLPYYVDRSEGKLQTLQLNPSELQYYMTDEIELNSANQARRAATTAAVAE